MRALKIVVVVMGIMLVVGFVALIAIVAGKVSRGGAGGASAGGSGGHPFVTNTIDLPRGARIEAMTTAPNRLILQLALPDNQRQLVIVDLTTGARIGTIELRSAP